MVARVIFLGIIGLSLLSIDFISRFGAPAEAQIRRETPRENVRRRHQQQATQHNPYWDGFILKRQGNCDAAIIKLYPIAQRGYGYEEAQTALGECLLRLAGLPDNNQQAPERAKTLNNDTFKQGMGWILNAAKRGNFTAQGVLVALYAANLGPKEDVIEGAKWSHLYLTNPTRLNLGAPARAQSSIDYLQTSMTKTDWLLGKERARNWSPDYKILPSENGGKENSTDERKNQ
ncbi:MAG: hypothetical protein ACR2OT_01340 [Parvibaculales bacterium]